MLALKRPDEAMKCYRESVASYRSTAGQNPMVSRFQWLLASELRAWAALLSSRRQYAEAKACYEESCEILEHSRSGSMTFRCMALPSLRAG